jgi:Fe-S-cluster-containing dehydrogenase component
MTQYAIVTDLNRCVGCLGCSVACKIVNGVPVGSYWNKTLRVGPFPTYEGAEFPDVYTYWLPVQCQHCENPSCVAVCPTGASHKKEDGTVQIDKEKCIGCQFCAMACPYGVRYLNEEEGVVEKCTMCEQKIIEGELPQCVAQCGARARFFGDLEQGIGSFVGAGKVGGEGADKSYDGVLKTYCTLDEIVEPYTDADIHHLVDTGNHPTVAYILRNNMWKGDE